MRKKIQPIPGILIKTDQFQMLFFLSAFSEKIEKNINSSRYRKLQLIFFDINIIESKPAKNLFKLVAPLILYVALMINNIG
jgi:hypothetical protein